MRITAVQGCNLRAAIDEPFEWPDGSAHERRAGVVWIETDAGLVGWGPAGHGWSRTIERAISSILVGRSPLETWPLWREMDARRVPMGVRGAIDVALWDLKGQALGVPIHTLLGGALRDRVPAYATGGYYGLPEDSMGWLQDKVGEAVDRGFRAYKMKIGARDPAYDLRRVDAVQQVLGGARRLAVDATTTYTRPLAMRVVPELEARDILWFEDPLPADDVDGYALLTQQCRVAITAHYGAVFGQLEALLRRRAVDQVQPNIAGGGGYTMALQTMGMARMQHVVYDPSCWSTHLHIAATLHLLAVMPSQLRRLRDAPPMIEFDTSCNPLRDDSLLVEPIDVEADGTVRVPDGPGLGVTVNEDVIARYAV